jgi:hypothetical protein
MDNIRFWQKWEPGLHRSFKFLGIAFLALGVSLIVAAWRSPAPSITWQYWQEREVLEKPVHQFQVGPFSLQVAANNIVLFEKLLGSDLLIQTWPVYFFLGSLLIGLAFLIAIASTLSRFWFFIASGLIIFLVTSLRLELLNVLGRENQAASIFLMVTIVGTGLLFQYYFQAASFTTRLLSFSAVLIGSLALLSLGSRAPNPVYYIAIGFIPASVVISILLAIFTAHEIIAFIIFLITRGLKGANGFAHFLILSLIYIANLFAVYLSNLGWFRWEYPINPIILLMVSAALGVWGIKRQQEQMEGFLLQGPFGPLAIMAMSVIAFGSSAFFYTSGNDAAIETISNLSLYAHIGYGGIFIFYVISNFGSFLRNNYPVMRALYNPSAMPFFTFRFAGTIAMLGFIFYNFWQRPINDTKGARDAAMGDYYVVSGDVNLAEGFYKKSDLYAFHNHHANFALANIEAARGNAIKERQYYLNAAERRPTEQAYLNAVNTLNQSAINLYAYLKNVQTDFPNSGAANNTLGLVYTKFNQLDSALFFFNLAKKDRLTASTAEINLLATAVKQNLNLDVDSLYQSLDTDKPGPLSNAFAFANSKNVVLDQEINLNGDTSLNLFTSSLVNNYLLNHLDSLDTAFITKSEKLARLNSNSDYFETVITACAHACYKNGMIDRAFKLMQEATAFTQSKGRNNNTMALWALDQRAPSVALAYVQYAMNQNYDGASLTKAIALTESGKHGEAIVLLDSLKKSLSVLAPVAESVQRVLLVKRELAVALNDMEKYAFSKYRLSYEDSGDFASLTSSISNADWKAKAILDRSKKLFEWDEHADAIKMYNQLNGIAISDRELFDEIRRHEMMMLAAIGNIDFLVAKVKGSMTWPRYRQSEKIYFDALIALASKDTITARKNLNWVSRHNSFLAEGVLADAAFTKQNLKNKLGAYDILANALQTNHQSIKLLKAYIREAKELGFDDFVISSDETLRQLLPPSLYKKFVLSFR